MAALIAKLKWSSTGVRSLFSTGLCWWHACQSTWYRSSSRWSSVLLFCYQFKLWPSRVSSSQILVNVVFFSLEVDHRSIRSWAVHSAFILDYFVCSISNSRGEPNGNSGFHRQIFQALTFCQLDFLSLRHFLGTDRIANDLDHSLHGFVANFDVRPRNSVLSVPRDAKRALLLANLDKVEMVPTCTDRSVHCFLRTSTIALGWPRCWLHVCVRLHQLLENICWKPQSMGEKMAIQVLRERPCFQSWLTSSHGKQCQRYLQQRRSYWFSFRRRKPERNSNPTTKWI